MIVDVYWDIGIGLISNVICTVSIDLVVDVLGIASGINLNLVVRQIARLIL